MLSNEVNVVNGMLKNKNKVSDSSLEDLDEIWASIPYSKTKKISEHRTGGKEGLAEMKEFVQKAQARGISNAMIEKYLFNNSTLDLDNGIKTTYYKGYEINESLSGCIVERMGKRTLYDGMNTEQVKKEIDKDIEENE